MASEEIILHQCLKQIEDSLKWGSSKDWTNNDFEKLSEKIEQTTHVRLSVTTLKRIWGKVKYDSAPTVTTLNALARYIGFENWRTFKQTQFPESNQLTSSTSDETGNTVASSRNIKNKRYLWLVVLATVLITITAFFFITNFGRIRSSDFEFSSKKIVTEGVPNSVVFNYDASASPTDSVFIQQSWDWRRRNLVSKHNKEYTSIYYYPGYFRAKLVVADQVVKEHDVFITSNGWTAAVNLEPVPAYLKQEDFLKDGILDITEEMIEALKIPMQPQTPQLRIHNVRQMNNLKTDNFIFETTVRNNFSTGTGACQKVEILILCKNDVFIIPLCSKRCVGDLYLIAAGQEVSSAQADLSGFGCDLNNWTKVKVEAKDKHACFFIDDKEVYSLIFENPASEIVGVQYRFEGVGAVKETSFSDYKKEIIF